MFTYQLKKSGKAFMFFERINILLLIILKIFLSTSLSLASSEQDCSNSSFYIEKINVDLTKESINEARTQAEYEAKLKGFNRLFKRLIIKDPKLKFDKTEISSLVDYLKINKEEKWFNFLKKNTTIKKNNRRFNKCRNFYRKYNISYKTKSNK